MAIQMQSESSICINIFIKIQIISTRLHEGIQCVFDLLIIIRFFSLCKIRSCRWCGKHIYQKDDKATKGIFKLQTNNAMPNTTKQISTIHKIQHEILKTKKHELIQQSE